MLLVFVFVTDLAFGQGRGDDQLPPPSQVKPPRGESDSTRKNRPDTAVRAGDSIYSIVDIPANFPGGEKAWNDYVHSRVRYPEKCLKDSLEGEVLLRFIINTRGFPSRIQVVSNSSECSEFREEAIRLVKSVPRLIPAQKNGYFVNSYREIVVRFRLD